MGTGAFFLAAKQVAAKRGIGVRFAGTEIDPAVLAHARARGLDDDDLSGVVVADFLTHPFQTKFNSIVANPPYIRHHRI